MKKQIIATSELPYVTEGLPKFNIEGDSGLKGDFYLSFVHDCSIIKLSSNDDDTTAMHENRPAPTPEIPPVGWWDFKKTVCGIETYYSYHDQIGRKDTAKEIIKLRADYLLSVSKRPISKIMLDCLLDSDYLLDVLGVQQN